MQPQLGDRVIFVKPLINSVAPSPDIYNVIWKVSHLKADGEALLTSPAFRSWLTCDLEEYQCCLAVVPAFKIGD